MPCKLCNPLPFASTLSAPAPSNSRHMLKSLLCALVLSITAAAQQPGCPDATPQQCLNLAFDAMGGRDRLQQLKSVRLETVGHTLVTEQSYRQAPFLVSYEHDHIVLDLAAPRLLKESRIAWPEADSQGETVNVTVVAGPNGGIRRGKPDAPCSLGDLDDARQALALGPARLLLTAAAAPDLHFSTPEALRSTWHTVLAFTWRNLPVRILLNADNHLPDAVETTQSFHDFWYFWGDVQQRVYFDNFHLKAGIVWPTNIIEERNGIAWRSSQAIDFEFNAPVDAQALAIDPLVAEKSMASVGWNRPFVLNKEVDLAPGVTLFPGAWNTTVVKQADGIVVLEAPISELYMKGAVEEAKKRYPGLPVKAVLSTSDSWPHVGGVRYAVSQAFPVYILDLNQPLLDRMMAAPHTLAPDSLEKSKSSRQPQWKIVSGKQTIGIGENRLELYPLRGASTERQYMVYFPDARLLYASDTLAMKEDGALYDPQLMHEVAQAVKRHNLSVETVYAMHEGPTPWSKILELLSKSEAR